MKIIKILLFLLTNTLFIAQSNLTGVSTYESIGLYWAPNSGSISNTAEVYYKQANENSWTKGHDLWFDSFEARKNLAGGIYSKHLTNFPEKHRNEYRGSIVNLKPGTLYNIEVRLKSGDIGSLNISTWQNPSELPIAKVVEVGSRSSQMNITESGTSSGYIKYVPNTKNGVIIDVNNNFDNCINIDGSYIIIDGLILKNARSNAIEIKDGRSDIIITNCDISNWGYEGADKLGFGHDLDAAVFGKGSKISRVTVESCRIYNPRFPSNAYDQARGKPYDNSAPYHPSGPNAISMLNTAGNHVYRNNNIFADWGHYFAYHFSGRENYSYAGAPNRDSDIYNNNLSNCWANSVEIDGAGCNVRVWGNKFDNLKSAISVSPSSVGPVYLFRNLGLRSRVFALISDSDEYGRADFIKTGGQVWGNNFYGAGKIYIYHNTVLQPSIEGKNRPLGFKPSIGGGGGNIYNVTSRNNIFLVDFPNNYIITDTDNDGIGSTSDQVIRTNSNDFDFDLFSGKIQPQKEDGFHEDNGIKIEQNDKVIFENITNDIFNLSPSSVGFDLGLRILGFNDYFSDSGPDMGAFEKYIENVDSFDDPSAPIDNDGLIVFLEGAFQIDKMDKPRISVPNNNPYQKVPWQMGDNSEIKGDISNIVDWVIIELRSEINKFSYWKSALLTIDGLVLNPDGSKFLFNNIVEKDYYLLVKHRNHLAVISSSKIALKNNIPIEYDFSDSISKAYGKEPMVKLENGKYGLFAGDADGNGVINNLDFGLVANNVFKFGYNQGDIDMNGAVNVLDYSKINKNILKSTNVP